MGLYLVQVGVQVTEPVDFHEHLGWYRMVEVYLDSMAMWLWLLLVFGEVIVSFELGVGFEFISYLFINQIYFIESELDA